ncbi:hypothetical protein [Clostridium algidicarnis]|uniref:hypothetical protein n=1 Tax=Clostridium algidicarnis TaxID=37659 RepID=UPI003FD72F4A
MSMLGSKNPATELLELLGEKCEIKKHPEQFTEGPLLCVRSNTYMKRREIKWQNKKSE